MNVWWWSCHNLSFFCFFFKFSSKVHSQMSTSRLKDPTPTLRPWTGYKMTSSIDRWARHFVAFGLFSLLIFMNDVWPTGQKNSQDNQFTRMQKMVSNYLNLRCCKQPFYISVFFVCFVQFSWTQYLRNTLRKFEFGKNVHLDSTKGERLLWPQKTRFILAVTQWLIL